MAIHVLYIHGISAIGGAETELLNILHSLDREKFLPYVACPQTGPLVAELHAIHIPTVDVVLPPWRKVKHVWKLPGGVFRLVQLLRAHRIDIVHVNDYWWGPIAWLAANFCGIPCIVHIRQQIEPHRVRQYWLTKFDKVLAVSESIRRVAVQSGVHSDRVEVLYSGINCRAIKPKVSYELKAKLRLEADQPVIGTVANLFERKGHEYLLEAMVLVKKVVPNVQCIIVGEGDSQYRQKLENIIRQKDLGQCVILVGFQNDVFEFLSIFDIFVLPSILEGFGIVLLEAMAMGKAIVATRVGGTSESVVNSETGILVSPGCSETMAAAILQLLQDPQRCKEMGMAGRRRVETYFDFSRTMDRLEAVYGELMQCGKST